MAVPWGSMRGDPTPSESSAPATNGFNDNKSNGFTQFTQSGGEVRVLNVPMSATKESLTEVFESVGQVTKLNILQPKDGYETTVAFVGFSTLDEAEGAVENLNGFEVDGQELQVKIAIKKPRDGGFNNDSHSKPFEERGDRQTRFADLEGKQVRVLGIPISLGEDEVRTFFEASGTVTNVKILPARDGYDTVAGFVTYNETTEASAAVETLNGTSLSGSPLRVQLARSKSSQPPSSFGGNQSNGDSGQAAPWQQRSSNNDGRNDDRVCRSCNKPGHIARSCPEGGQTCFKCGSPEHLANDCNAMNSNGEGGNSSMICHRCGEPGHMSRECPAAAEQGGPPPPAPVTYVPPEESDDKNSIFQHTTRKGINFENYEKVPVEMNGKDVIQPIGTFQDANLNERVLTNISNAKYTTPTPVQKYAIPAILGKRDLMACAQTGSGKTAAFLVPIVSRLLQDGLPGDSSNLDEDGRAYPYALIVVPTRELAVQIFNEAKKFTYGSRLLPCVVYGGVSVSYQLSNVERGSHILVATPGRLDDFVKRGRINLSRLKYFILDEADRMLDMGFLPQINGIREHGYMPPQHLLNTLMFSATFPEEIQKLAADFLNNYLFLTVGRLGSTSSNIEQIILEVKSTQKRDRLEMILNEEKDDADGRTLVFVQLKKNSDFLASFLSQKGLPATSISGDRTQQEREAALIDFKRGRAKVLVATAVAARGLDIEGVKHVINFDLPQAIDEYVHRIGRTGRIGNKGKATAFYDYDADNSLARGLVKVLSGAAQSIPEWLETEAMSAVGTSFGPVNGKFSSRDTREAGGFSGQNTRFGHTNGNGPAREERPSNGSNYHNQSSAPPMEEVGESWD